MRVEGTQSVGAGAMSDNRIVSEESLESLGKQEFLDLLVTELRYQDPLNPVDDKEFLSQLAQFSALEEMMAVSKSIDSLVTMQQNAGLAGQANLVGKNAEVRDPNTEDVISGTISGVKLVEGVPYAIVGSRTFSLDQIVALYA